MHQSMAVVVGNGSKMQKILNKKDKITLDYKKMKEEKSKNKVETSRNNGLHCTH